jgi:hypothetical protein
MPFDGDERLSAALSVWTMQGSFATGSSEGY